MKKIILYTVFLAIPFWGYCQRINEKTALKVAEKVLRKDKPNLKNQVFEKRIPLLFSFRITRPNGAFDPGGHIRKSRVLKCPALSCQNVKNLPFTFSFCTLANE